MMFGTTMVGIVLIGIVALADPGHIGPMFANPRPPSPDWGVLILALGFIGVAVGSIWMFRIARDDPEPDQHAWRYRRDR
jgi:Flp pilus assembly protein TadB